MKLFHIFLFSAGFVIGIYAHEADMAKNFKETGDAKAFWHEIKCPKGE